MEMNLIFLLHQVSPQFQNVRCSERGRRRRTRQRRHSIAVHKGLSSDSCNKENTIKHSSNRLGKFTCLKFIGDETNVESIAEGIEIYTDSDASTKDETGDCAGSRCDINENESPCDRCTRRRRSVNCRSRRKIFSEQLISAGTGFDVGAVTKTKTLTYINSTDVLSRDEKTFREIMDDSNCADVPSDSPNDAHRRQSIKDKPPIKRLFASQLSSYKGDGHRLYLNFDDDNENGDQGDSVTVSDIGNKSEPMTTLDSEDSVNSSNVRRSARIRELQKMLQSSDSPFGLQTLARQARVLASETPENEVGWSKRKRQLIGYIKKTI